MRPTATGPNEAETDAIFAAEAETDAVLAALTGMSAGGMAGAGFGVGALLLAIISAVCVTTFYCVLRWP